MKKGISLLFIALCLFIIRPRIVDAEITPSIYFSEVAWAGSSISTADEWIELANLSNNEIDLSGWKITRWSDGQEKEMIVINNGKIPANGNFLIANYAPPGTVLPFTADLVSTDVSLANTKLQLKLYDSNSFLIDTADDGAISPYAPPAGSNTIKASMERVLPIADGSLLTSWKTATTPIDISDLTRGYGTPQISGYPELSLDKKSIYYRSNQVIVISGLTTSQLYSGNQISIQIICGSNLTTISPDDTGRFNTDLSIFDNPNYCLITVSDPKMVSTISQLTLKRLPLIGVIINEAMPNPSAGEEWIELYNQSNQDIDLADWQLDDKINAGSGSYIFSTKIIKAGEFLSLPKSLTGIGLNNDGDEINLIDPLGEITDHANFSSAPANESWVRLNDRSFGWSQHQTKSQHNQLPERKNYTNLVKINEIMPNPVGSDEDGEWVELISNSNQPVDLYGWLIDDEDGGSSPYKFTQSLIIEPNQYLAINRTKSKIAFNNDADSVRLFAPDDTLVDVVIYKDVAEGESYARFESDWQWTNVVTKNSFNIKSAQTLESSLIQSLQTTNVENTATRNVEKNEISIIANPISKITLLPILEKIDFNPINNFADGKVLGISNSKSQNKQRIWLFLSVFSVIIMAAANSNFRLWKLLKTSTKPKNSPTDWHPG